MAESNILELLKKEANALESRLAGLKSAISALSGDVGRARGRKGAFSLAGPKKRVMSAAARKRISDAQKARWAKQRAAKK
jgi:hypothetical protein